MKERHVNLPSRQRPWEKRFRSAWPILCFFVFLVVSTDLFAEQLTVVRVQAPQSVSGQFEILIDIDKAFNLDSGQFDLVFDPDTIQIQAVNNGAIGETVVPVDLWNTLNPGRIRVLFNFPGVRGISGTGHLAKIRAKAVGKTDRPVKFAFQKGLLVDKEAQSIPARWLDGKVDVENYIARTGTADATGTGDAPEHDTRSRGMTISTPMAIAGLAVLACIPGLLLVLSRQKKRKS
ncbi:cohesin domain-containing protein [Desulfospira joergensenii]|uniref:cohesin domain-containing protein n=1 Tax=Desulfospira joergensenii TaxID=53329 RepID=UPI0003B45FD9|nr:cohesin domain-containing protein [Desulfospira joergensenii]